MAILFARQQNSYIIPFEKICYFCVTLAVIGSFYDPCAMIMKLLWPCYQTFTTSKSLLSICRSIGWLSTNMRPHAGWPTINNHDDDDFKTIRSHW